MAEHPILFSGPMVQAIFAGLKTMTRRVVDLKPYDRCCGNSQRVHVPHGPGVPDCPTGWPCYLKIGYCESCDGGGGRIWPRYEVGDPLWVRETWACPQQIGGSFQREKAVYRADPWWSDKPAPYGRWRPSIFMPRRASRLTLLVTDVRVERVQEITEEDAIHEGMTKRGVWWDVGPDWQGDGIGYPDARDGFSHLWDALNAKRGHPWDVNPWVWVVSFERTEVLP